MSEIRSVIETNLTKEEAYKKVLKRAQKLGYKTREQQSQNEPNIKIEKRNYTPIWWIAVLIGLFFYIIPGILILIFWKPIDFCQLSFEDSDEKEYKTLVIAKMKGEIGQEFFSQVSGLLSTK